MKRPGTGTRTPCTQSYRYANTTRKVPSKLSVHDAFDAFVERRQHNRSTNALVVATSNFETDESIDHIHQRNGLQHVATDKDPIRPVVEALVVDGVSRFADQKHHDESVDPFAIQSRSFVLSSGASEEDAAEERPEPRVEEEKEDDEAHGGFAQLCVRWIPAAIKQDAMLDTSSEIAYSRLHSRMFVSVFREVSD
ncbi:hypothetical protein GQ600_25109 [Phytophthora cactorum]|nr:hypothetical protein GQ600_25109 [Phytophthora cactorum]